MDASDRRFRGCCACSRIPGRSRVPRAASRAHAHAPTHTRTRHSRPFQKKVARHHTTRHTKRHGPPARPAAARPWTLDRASCETVKDGGRVPCTGTSYCGIGPGTHTGVGTGKGNRSGPAPGGCGRAAGRTRRGGRYMSHCRLSARAAMPANRTFTRTNTMERVRIRAQYVTPCLYAIE